MSEDYDVIIVGGGILGCAAAFQICTRSDLKVALIERGLIGAQTTSLAASVVTRAKSSLPQVALILETFKSILELEDLLGTSVGFNHVGSLHIAQSETSALTFSKQTSLLREVGDEPQELSVNQAKKLAPWLNLDRAELIVHNSRDGFVDPYRLASAYVQGAKASGNLDLLQSTEVVGLTSRDQKVTGVDTDKGHFSAEKIVCSAGPWTNQLLAPLGSGAAMAPVRSHYWITGSNPVFPANSPVVLLPEANAYARPEVGGLMFGLRERDGKWALPCDLPKSLQGFTFDDDTHGWLALEDSVGPFLHLCPSLESVEIHHYISGPSCYTPDGNYLVGAAPNLDNLYLATGCCGSGIGISGGVGNIIAELVLGNPKTFDVTAFAPDRFGEFDPFDAEFLALCARSRSAKKAG